MHPHLARSLGVADGDLVTVTSRRGSMTLPAHVVNTIRPDTVFIPYHWPGDAVGEPAHEPRARPDSRMPEFKVAAVRSSGGGHAATADARLDCTRTVVTVRDRRRAGVRDRPEPLHRLPGLRAGLHGVRHASRAVTDPSRTIDRAARRRPRRWCACTARTRPARGVSGRRDQADREGHRAVGAQAALHRLLELRDRVPVRRAQVHGRDRPDDEVRHVHRPHHRRAHADVRLGVPERSPVVRHARAVRRSRRGSLLRDFFFGNQSVRTKVYTVVDDLAGGPLDVLGRLAAEWLDDPFGLDAT